MTNIPIIFSKLFTSSIVTILLFVFSISAIASSDCKTFKGCERKFCEIKNQIDIAKKNGNTHKEKGLEKALEEAGINCTDEGLREGLVKEIKDTKDDLKKHEYRLKKAEEDGDMESIQKYDKKIEKDKNELQLLENELSSLK